MQNCSPKTHSSESGPSSATLFSMNLHLPVLHHKDAHYFGHEGPSAAHAPTLALYPLPPQISGRVYLAAAVGSLDKKKTGSSCPPPSTAVFPSSESLGPEPASCSGGGLGLQRKREKRRPWARARPTCPTSLLSTRHPCQEATWSLLCPFLYGRKN